MACLEFGWHDDGRLLILCYLIDGFEYFWRIMLKKMSCYEIVSAETIWRIWAVSLAGRALPWHGRGQEFESPTVHHFRFPEENKNLISNFNLIIMTNPEKQPSFQETKKIKELTEEEIKQIALEVGAIIMPLYAEIEKLRKENPQREVGGRIVNGTIELLDESRWKEYSVIGESCEEERRMAKAGILSFHTHPDSGFTDESAQDILATYFRLKELIFHKDGVLLLIALKELPTEKIREINEQAWEEARENEEQWGDPDYWFWKGNLQASLPICVINLIDKNEPK